MRAGTAVGIAAMAGAAGLLGYLLYTGKLQGALGLGGAGGAGKGGGGVKAKTTVSPPTQPPPTAPDYSAFTSKFLPGGEFAPPPPSPAIPQPTTNVPLPPPGTAIYVPEPVNWSASLPTFQTSPAAAPSILAVIAGPSGTTPEPVPIEQSFAAVSQRVWMRVNACGVFGVGGGPWGGMNVAVYPEGGNSTIWGGSTDTQGAYVGQFNIVIPPGRYTVLMSPSSVGNQNPGEGPGPYQSAMVQGMVGRTLNQLFRFFGDNAAVNVEVQSGQQAVINLPCY